MIFLFRILEMGIAAVEYAVHASHIEFLRAEARARPLTDSEQAWLHALESARLSPIDRSSTPAFGALEQVRLHQARLRKLLSPRER